MTESGTEIRSVDRTVSRRFRGVEVFATGAVELDGFLIGDIGEAEREEGLTVTEHSWTSSEISFLVFIDL